jgi:hypothetical protein
MIALGEAKESNKKPAALCWMWPSHSSLGRSSASWQQLDKLQTTHLDSCDLANSDTILPVRMINGGIRPKRDLNVITWTEKMQTSGQSLISTELT